MRLYSERPTFYVVLLYSYYSETAWVHGWAARFSTIQPQSTNSLFFPPLQRSLRHLMTFLPKLGIIFCLSMTITVIWPQACLAVFVKRVSLFTTTRVRKLLFWGLMQLHKDTRYSSACALYTNTIHQQV